MDKREQIKKAIENKEDCCFKMALGLAELADEETIDLIYNQFFVKGNFKEIEKARKEILSFLSGANYKNNNDHKDNDDENEKREILVGKLLNLRTFTGYFYLNKKLNKSSNDQRSKKLSKDYPGAKIKDLLSYPDLKYLD